MTIQWKEIASIGAVAGVNLKESDGTVLADSAVKNSSIALGLSGTGLTLTNAGSGVTLSNASVGLGNVDNDSTATIRAGTTKANVGLSNVDNDSTATIRAGTTAANVGLGNVTNESKATMFAGPTFTGTVAGVTKSHVGLSNVDNDSTTTIREGTTKTHVGLSNVPNTDATNAGNIASGTLGKARGGFGEDVSSKSGALSVSSGTFSFGTLPAGVGGTGLTSTSTLLNSNVTTFSVDKGNLIVWSNLNSNLTPSNTDHDWTITWYNGAGTSLGTTVIRANVACSNVALDIMETVSNGASSTINLGGAVTSGNIQTTTVTKNSVVCTLKAQIIDGSGWDFK